MRTRVVWLAAVFLIGFLGLSPNHAQEGVNELTNGGFEEGPLMPLDTWAAGTWNVYGDHKVQVVSELRGAAVPEAPAEGKYCLHVTVPAAGANSWDVGLRHIGHTFKRGKKYTLSVFLKCKSGTLRVNLKTELGEDPWTAYGERQVTMTDKWAEYSTTTPVFTADVTPGTLTFHIAFAAGDFWVDGVRWYEGGYVPPSSPSRGAELDRLIDQLKHNDSGTRAKAASALATLGDKRAVEPLIAALKDNDDGVRMSAALALPTLGDKRAVEPLIAALKDNDDGVRMSAALALATLGDERAVEPFIEALKDNDDGVRRSAVTALGRLGDKRAVEPLIAAIKDNDARVQRYAATAQGRLGDKRAVEPLIAALKDNDASMRQSAASALGRLGDERVFEPLVAALKDNDASVRQSAASALGRLRWQPATDLEQAYYLVASQKWAELVKLGPSAVEPLIAVLKDNDAGVRRSVAEALAELDWQPATDLQRAYYLVALQKWAEVVKLGPSAVEPLLVAFETRGREVADVQTSAREALTQIGPLAVEPTIAALKDKDTRLHSSAVRALGILRDKRAVEPLIVAMKDTDAGVRQFSARALGRLGDKRAVEPLIAALKDSDASVQQSAASALSRSGDERAIEPLIDALGDEDPGMRESVDFALRRLADKGSADRLVAHLEDKDLRLRALVAEMLAKMRDERAFEPLIAALKDKDTEVRRIAAGALGRLGDKRAFEPLIVALKDTDVEVRRMAARALGRLGDTRAVEPLIAVLKDENASVRSFAAEGLGELGDKRAVEPLIAALKDKDAGVRGSVAGALAQLGDERAVEPLREAMRDDDGIVLSSVAFALARLLGDERAVEPLLTATENAEEFEGLALLGMLMRIGPPAVEPLIAALKQEDKRVRYTAVFVLVHLDDQRAVEPVITFLKSESDTLRAPGAKALEATGSSTVEYLIELLKHKDLFYVRSSSAWTLGWLGDKRAVEPLVAAIGDASVVGNANAGVALVQVALALGRLGDKRAIEPLIDVVKRMAPLKDDKVNTLLAGEMAQEMAQDWRRLVVKVLDALVKIGPPALEPLIGVLKDENAHVRSFAAEGMGELGDKRAVQPLVAVLKDEDEEVRRSATEALTKLGWQPGHELQ